MTISLWGTAKNSLSAAIAASAALVTPACAGPPFETDDPAPTDVRHWEVYLFADAGGRGAEFDGVGGVDVNYGPVPGVQLTATLPLRISSGDAAGIAVRDVDLSVKYRFLNRKGWSAAIAPIVTMPLPMGMAVSGDRPCDCLYGSGGMRGGRMAGAGRFSAVADPFFKAMQKAETSGSGASSSPMVWPDRRVSGWK